MKILLLTLFFAWGSNVNAQYSRNQGAWKKNRSEVNLALGVSNFLGELGGRDQVGSDFVWDLETRVFKPALSIGYRYKIAPQFAVNTQFSFAVLAGDDALTKEPFRYNRNLHFRSRILEVTSVIECTIFQIAAKSKYELEGVTGSRSTAYSFIAFLGLGGMKFNPQAKAGEDWYDLRPLGTEGQNFNDGPEPYSLFTMVIPVGIGMRYTPKRKQYSLGLTIGHRMTFTDYIDDVSTVYYNRAAIGSQFDLSLEESLLAQYFSDPARGFYLDDEGTEVALNSTGTGAQRGDDADNDAYLFGQLTFSYAFQSKPYKRKKSKAKKGRNIVF